MANEPNTQDKAMADMLEALTLPQDLSPESYLYQVVDYHKCCPECYHFDRKILYNDPRCKRRRIASLLSDIRTMYHVTGKECTQEALDAVFRWAPVATGIYTIRDILPRLYHELGVDAVDHSVRVCDKGTQSETMLTYRREFGRDMLTEAAREMDAKLDPEVDTSTLLYQFHPTSCKDDSSSVEVSRMRSSGLFRLDDPTFVYPTEDNRRWMLRTTIRRTQEADTDADMEVHLDYMSEEKTICLTQVIPATREDSTDYVEVYNGPFETFRQGTDLEEQSKNIPRWMKWTIDYFDDATREELAVHLESIMRAYEMRP